MFLSGIGSAINSTGTSASDSSSLNSNFDTFLQLLTTQLRNQNPMEPLDANEFTKQLVQYSGVEQSIKQNKNLESLIQLQAVNAATAATSFLGKAVTVESASTALANGQANWLYYAGGSSQSATFTITDDTGKVVHEETREIGSGKDTFSWDGYADDGSEAGDGFYTLTIDASDEDGNTVPVSISVSAIIDGVDFSGSEPVLLSGDRGVKLSDVTSVVEPSLD